MRSFLLAFMVLIPTSLPATAGERIYVPHITREMQQKYRPADPVDPTRNLTLTEKREQNARPAAGTVRGHEVRTLTEQRLFHRSQSSSSAGLARNITEMRERNATASRQAQADLARARQRLEEARRQAQRDQAWQLLQRQKAERKVQALDPRRQQDRAGMALQTQKREAAARQATQSRVGSNRTTQRLSISQMRTLNRR